MIDERAKKKTFSFSQIPINRALKRASKKVLLIILLLGFAGGVFYTKYVSASPVKIEIMLKPSTL